MSLPKEVWLFTSVPVVTINNDELLPEELELPKYSLCRALALLDIEFCGTMLLPISYDVSENSNVENGARRIRATSQKMITLPLLCSENLPIRSNDLSNILLWIPT